jgi:arylsulfatase A-like enzyme
MWRPFGRELERRLMRLSCWILVAVALLPLSAFAEDAGKPNIVFIIADDLGYGDLGCYGQQKIQTPNLDRMAAEGVKFTDAYAGTTVCAPSRCILMTGQHGGHARVRSNAPIPLEPEDVTIAEVMKDAGYDTALMGKWALGWEGWPSNPNNEGFDYFFGYLDNGHAHNHYPTWLWLNDGRKEIEGNTEKAPGVCGECRHYADDLFAQDAVRYIKEPRERPFFLYFAPIAPHANNERFALEGNGMETPGRGAYADKDWPDQQKGHAQMITLLDGHVGQILDALRETGQDRNTIVFFTSDNGPLHEGGALHDFFDSNGPFQGYKRSLHDGGIRTPLIAWGPGRITPGTTTSHVCAFWDVLPTLAELGGGKAPDNTDGISFAPTLLGREGQRQHEWLYWEFHEGGFYQAIRAGQWKAISNNLREIALFNLHTDIGEEHDIADQHPEIVAQMLARFESARTPAERYEPKPRPKPRSERAEPTR